MPMPSIRILEKRPKQRGDLFARLMGDLFVALGYDQPRLNVHKSGREVDLMANHRLEPRRAVAECKATSKPIGGADLNKFAGVVDAEIGSQRAGALVGYFVSLGGFTESAIEQEKQRKRTTIVTLNAEQIVDELVRGRILIDPERAVDLAGRLASGDAERRLDPPVELLAHQRGWIWAVFYASSGERTGVALVHSDGTLLARAVAEEIVAADLACGGRLNGLECLNPLPRQISSRDPRATEALNLYGQYLENECGYIQLDGLPADSDAGSRKLRLENLFVPLHLDLRTGDGDKNAETVRCSVGDALTKYNRLAIMAAPGGGKSTLVRRLAVAYGNYARRGAIDDGLPDRNWFPLFFRCRELRALARSSFADLLEALSQREPVRQEAQVFLAVVNRALLEGRILLLVDGLDEIADSGDRGAFVSTLRAALHAYPHTSMVVTSREAGYRHIAAHLASVAKGATISSFDDDDIRRLTVSWHSEVVGRTDRVRDDALDLADTIIGNDRIKRLAVNPLLLTTLLLVKRWVGSLPTRRAVLYGKAVEVLLMTWNTEGHEPLPEEETLPQLCYVASSMMMRGVQKVSRPRLRELLQASRDAMPTELGYVRGSVDEFLYRVEYRSSLLMMSGLDVEEGQLVEFFEFRHLTFQEFLAARAMVQGWYPGRRAGDSLASALEQYFDEESWREVIPLAAVLGGRQTEALLEGLRDHSQRMTVDVHSETPGEPRLAGEFPSSVRALVGCLCDEAAAHPVIVRSAMREIVRWGGRRMELSSLARVLAQGRYGTEFREEARRAYLESDGCNPNRCLAQVVIWQVLGSESLADAVAATKSLHDLVREPERIAQCEGALGLMYLAYRLVNPLGRLNRYLLEAQEEHGCDSGLRSSIGTASAQLVTMLFSEDLWREYAACWALAWVGRLGALEPPTEPDLLGRLFWLWSSRKGDLKRVAGWALRVQPVVARAPGGCCSSVDRQVFRSVLRGFDKLGRLDRQTILVVAYYLDAMPGERLVELALQVLADGSSEEGGCLREIVELVQAEVGREVGVKARRAPGARRRR